MTVDNYKSKKKCNQNTFVYYYCNYKMYFFLFVFVCCRKDHFISFHFISFLGKENT